MKRIVLTCLLLMVLVVQAKHRRLNLQTAMDLKLIKANAVSLGSYQGNCISMSLKNLSADSLQVIVEAGRRLNSLDDRYQDIIITRQELITLKKAEEKKFDVRGYCCQASNTAPCLNAKYGINKMADSGLVSLAQFLNANKFDQHAEQQAIWALSDKRPTAAISNKNDSLVLPLKKLVALIKHEKLPWYNLMVVTYVYSTGHMDSHASLMKGNMEFSSNEEGYGTLKVYNEKGEQVCATESRWIKAGNNQQYLLNLPVKTLSAGKYRIELSTAKQTLATQVFEI